MNALVTSLQRLRSSRHALAPRYHAKTPILEAQTNKHSVSALLGLERVQSHQNAVDSLHHNIFVLDSIHPTASFLVDVAVLVFALLSKGTRVASHPAKALLPRQLFPWHRYLGACLHIETTFARLSALST